MNITEEEIIQMAFYFYQNTFIGSLISILVGLVVLFLLLSLFLRAIGWGK